LTVHRIVHCASSTRSPPHRNTITSRAELWEDLDAVATTGIAFDREEHTEGISAVGAVVRDAFGSMGAITIPMPTQRFTGPEGDLAERLRAVAAEATRALGG
jgi:DNA-binding IclR family transcriptional regulator